jgi:hypothetical protein
MQVLPDSILIALLAEELAEIVKMDVLWFFHKGEG